MVSNRTYLAAVLLPTLVYSLLLNASAQSRRSRLTTGFDDVVMAISFSPDGRSLAIARGATESAQRVGRVELWSTDTGELLHSIKGFDGPVWSVSFSPDGRTLVTGSSEYHSDKIQERKRNGRLLAELKWWDPATGELKHKLTMPDEDRVSFRASYSPQGSVLATVEHYWERSLNTYDPPNSNIGLGVQSTLSSAIDLKLRDAQTGELRLKLKDGFHDYSRFPSRGYFPRSFASFSDSANRAEAIFSRDGRLVACWSGAEIKIWDTQSGEKLRTLKKLKGMLGAVAFSPDGKLLAAAVVTLKSRDGALVRKSEIKLFDTGTGKLVNTINARTEVISALAFAANGRQIISGGLVGRNSENPGGAVELFDLHTGSMGALRTGQRGVFSLVLSPDGRALALQSDTSSVEIVSTDNWKVKHVFDTGTAGDVASRRSTSRFLLTVKRVTALAFSSDGHSLAGEVEGESIKKWDVRTGEVKRQLPSQDSATIVSIAPDSSSIVTVGDDAALRLWSVDDGSSNVIPKEEGLPISAIASSRNGGTIAVARGGEVGLWNRASRSKTKSLSPAKSTVAQLAFSPDDRLIGGSDDGGNITVWNVASGQLLTTINTGGKVNVLRFSPDGHLIATASDDAAVSLWIVQSGTLQTKLKKHEAPVNALAFSNDGRLLVSGSDDRSAIIWEVASGKPVHTLKGHDLTVSAVAFSPDASMVACGSGNAAVVLWDVRNGKLNRVLK